MVTAVDLGDDGDRNHQKMPIEVSDETAYQICTDHWYQFGFVLTTGINSSYILWYSVSIMVPLGCIGIVVGMLLAGAISLYSNVLVDRLHNFGGERQIRYRDFAGNFYGLNSQKRDYSILTSHWDKIAFGAIANLVFAYNTGMVPKIQAKILNTSSYAGTRVNWKETQNAHVFKVDLPGMSRGEIKVEVEAESVLQISGERKSENEEKTDTWHLLECSSGTFLRRFHLPENAKLAEAKVSFDNSILTVFVPKARAKKAGVRSLVISIPVDHHFAAF